MNVHQYMCPGTVLSLVDFCQHTLLQVVTVVVEQHHMNVLEYCMCLGTVSHIQAC